jgi:hypothetical protein
MANATIVSLLSAVAKSSGDSAWVAPTLIVSLLALVVSVSTFFIAGRRARIDKQRQLFADAFEAIATYREYPFIVRRRDAGDGAAERSRISGELSGVQAKLNAYSARLRVEDPYIGARYVELVAATRRVAGALIKEAWETDPIASDGEIHNPGWDMSELEKFDQAYLTAVSDHLGWLHAPLRRRLRR